MRDVLNFASLMTEIELVIKLHGDAPAVLCSPLEKPVIPVAVYKDNQRAIALMVSLQIRPRTNHITINYHHFQNFVANGDVKIKHVNTKEQIVDIFMNILDYELFEYIRYKLNGWWVNGILLYKGV